VTSLSKVDWKQIISIRNKCCLRPATAAERPTEP
jgi:hypothetical protein